MSAVLIPEEFIAEILRVGRIARLEAILKGNGAKKMKGAIGGKTTKGGKCSTTIPLIKHWVIFS